MAAYPAFNRDVESSSLSRSTTCFSPWRNGLAHESTKLGVAGSNPAGEANFKLTARDRMTRCLPAKQDDVGLNPTAQSMGC
jgi:hypothetical protein